MSAGDSGPGNVCQMLENTVRLNTGIWNPGGAALLGDEFQEFRQQSKSQFEFRGFTMKAGFIAF